MEKILKEEYYPIPSIVNRIVDLGIDDYDRNYKIHARIIDPTGFENHPLNIIRTGKGISTAVHKRIGGKKLIHQRVKIKTYQIVPDEKPVEEEKIEPVKEQVKLNQGPIGNPGEKTGIIKRIASAGIRPKNVKAEAIKEAEERKERLTKTRSEVDHASALKPIGLDGQRILTGDNVDYTKGVGMIWNAIKLQKHLNKQEGNTSPNTQKLLYEYYNILSFSGIEQVIGFYIALGPKTKGKGDLEYLSKWYIHNLSRIFCPTSMGEIQKKGAQLVNGFKFKKFKRPPNPGFSIKYAEKIIGDLFKKEHSNEDMRMSDLQCEVYQPIFFTDEQTRVYSRAETPDAKIVDVIVNTALDPRYFQSRKIENGLISAGPIRRSFDLPIAQHNNNIKMTSLGSQLEYKETPKRFEGMNDAQVNRVDKAKSKRLDWLDTRKYMLDHPHKVKYIRIETAHLYGVAPNSIAMEDLVTCMKSADRSDVWTNDNKLKLDWRLK
jgi:hypothetical protein